MPEPAESQNERSEGRSTPDGNSALLPRTRSKPARILRMARMKAETYLCANNGDSGADMSIGQVISGQVGRKTVKASTHGPLENLGCPLDEPLPFAWLVGGLAFPISMCCDDELATEAGACPFMCACG